MPVHREARHASHGVGADVDRPLRLDLARGGHDRFEIAALDRLEIDGDAVFALKAEVGEGNGAEHHDHREGDEELLLSRHVRKPVPLR
jgi:hypothetical protein